LLQHENSINIQSILLVTANNPCNVSDAASLDL
jgi:hypothetical protein